MRNNSLIVTASLAVLVFALVPSTAIADAQIGVNAAIRNQVQEKASYEAAPRPAVIRAPVHLGDSVISGSQSALQLLLLDQSVFTVGANARVTLDRFVYDPDRGASDVAASVAKGAFRFMSGHSLAGQGHNAISTPVATIGVRGTVLEGAVGPDALNIVAQQAGLPPFSGDPSNVTLVVLEGPGTGTGGFDHPGAIDVTSGGVTITLDHPGEAVLIYPGQPPIGPFDLNDSAFAQLNTLLKTVPGDNGDNLDFDVASAGDASGDNTDPGLPGGDPFNTETGGIDMPVPFSEGDFNGG